MLNSPFFPAQDFSPFGYYVAFFVSWFWFYFYSHLNYRTIRNACQGIFLKMNRLNIVFLKDR